VEEIRTMSIDEQKATGQTHWESLVTNPAVFPQTPEQTRDIGPLADDAAFPGATRPIADGREAITEGQSLSPLQASLRRLGRDRRAMISLVIILLVMVGAYTFPAIYVHLGPTVTNSTGRSVGPEVYHNPIRSVDIFGNDKAAVTLHPMGTDHLGRDILARVMSGVNVSIDVALLVESMDITLGILIGVLAGFFGKFVDTLLARFTDIVFAFPGFLLILMVAATLGPWATAHIGVTGRLVLVALTIGITIWPFMARLVRGQTLQYKEQQFVEAARTVGSSDGRIIRQHIVPNLISIVITAASLNIVGVIVTEAVVSLLGFGVTPPGASLGLSIFDGIGEVTVQASEVLWPVLILILLVGALSFLGDGIRDAFDPRTKD
jgi:ABC-type dipeptide/oligopeptide/nickel transport system permease subunit